MTAKKSMKLPNAERAIIDLPKLRDYCLAVEHPRGKHKARVFESVLGFTADHADDLRARILDGICSVECEVGEGDDFGQRFTVDLPMDGPLGSATVRTGWIIKKNEVRPRLTTCFVRI
ncbi:MAG: DUF6883 domain-containing protein [Verrucomicrobiota bacterium]